MALQIRRGTSMPVDNGSPGELFLNLTTVTLYHSDGTGWTPTGPGSSFLPTQTGNAGKVLKTDGTNASWIHQNSNIVNVKNYGAVGDGTTNDTTAIVNAIAALNATYGGVVYFPPGKYLTDKITVIRSNVAFIGDGSEASILKLRTAGGSTQLVYVDGNNYLVKNLLFQNIALEGSNPTYSYVLATSVGTEEGLHLESTNGANGSNTIRNVVLLNCSIYGFNKYGLYAKDLGSHDAGRNGDSLNVYNLRLSYNYYGIYLDTYAEYCKFTGVDAWKNWMGGYMNSGNNLWFNCQFNQNVQGFKMYGGLNNAHGAFNNCAFNHNSDVAFYADSITAGQIFIGCFFFQSAMTIINCDRMMFSRCYIALTTSLVLDANTQSYIRDCVFWNAYGGSTVTRQNSDTTHLFDNFWYQTGATAYSDFKKINDPLELGRIRGIETDENPTAAQLTSGANAKDKYEIYMKGDKFVIAYNNGGTVTYITIPLDGSTTTWTHSTSAP